MKILKSIYIFIVFFSIHLFAITMGWNKVSACTKPLLLGSLIIYYLTNAKFNYMVFFALVLSLLGDVLLIFQQTSSLFFIFGLAAFLAAHICYIIYFFQIKKQGTQKGWNTIVIVATLAYGAALMSLLYPKLGDMKLPVLLYAITICTMLITALHVTKNNFFAIGATLFVVSDSILAINKFYSTFAAASFLIMLTYGLAQVFITTGVIKNKG